MHKVCFKILRLICVIFVLPVFSQKDLTQKYNVIVFRADSGVYANNELLYQWGEEMVVVHCINRKDGCHGCEECACFKCYSWAFFIIPTLKQNLIYIDNDSVFYNLKIQLIKTNDTMNVIVNNITYKTNPMAFWSIKNVPFHKG